MAQGSGYDMEWVSYGYTYETPFYQQVPREWGVIDIATDFETRSGIQHTYAVGSFIHHLVWNDVNLYMDQAGFGTSVGCGNRLYSSNIHGCPTFSASGFLSSFDPAGNNLSSIQFFSSNNGHTVVKGVCVDPSNQYIYVVGYFDEGLNITLPGYCNNQTGSFIPPGCGINTQYVGPNQFAGGGVFLAMFDNSLNVLDVKFLASNQNNHIDVNGIRYNPTTDMVYVVGSFVNELQVWNSAGSRVGYPLPSVGSIPASSGFIDIDGYVIAFDGKTLNPLVGNVVRSTSTADFSESITAIDVLPRFNISNPSYVAVGGFHTGSPIVQEPLDMMGGIGLDSNSPTPALLTYTVGFPNFTGGNDLFIAKLDDKTNFVWMNVIQSSPNRHHEIHRIAADADGTNERISITGQLLPNSAGATVDYFTSAIAAPFPGTPSATGTSMAFGCSTNVAESFLFTYDDTGAYVSHNIHTTCEQVVVPGNFTDVHGSIGLGVDVELDNATGTPNPLTLNCGIYDGRSSNPAGVLPPTTFNSMEVSYDPIGFMSRYETPFTTFSNIRSFPVILNSAPSESPFGLTSVQYPKENGNSSGIPLTFSKINGYTRMGGFLTGFFNIFHFDNANTSVNLPGVVSENPLSILGGSFNEVRLNVRAALFVGAFGFNTSGLGIGNAANLKQNKDSNLPSESFEFINTPQLVGIQFTKIPGSISVVDVNGRVLEMKMEQSENTLAIPKNQFINGLYLLCFELEGKRHCKRFQVTN